MGKVKVLKDVKAGVKYVEDKNGVRKKIVKIFIPPKWFEEVKNNNRKWKPIIKKVLKTLWQKHIENLDIDKELKEYVKDLKITTEGFEFWISIKNLDSVREWLFNKKWNLVFNSIRDLNEKDIKALRLKIEKLLNGLVRNDENINRIDKILEKLQVIGENYGDGYFSENIPTYIFVVNNETKELIDIPQFKVYPIRLENLRGDNLLIEMFMEYASEYVNEY